MNRADKGEAFTVAYYKAPEFAAGLTVVFDAWWEADGAVVVSALEATEIYPGVYTAEITAPDDDGYIVIIGRNGSDDMAGSITAVGEPTPRLFHVHISLSTGQTIPFVVISKEDGEVEHTGSLVEVGHGFYRSPDVSESIEGEKFIRMGDELLSDEFPLTLDTGTGTETIVIQEVVRTPIWHETLGTMSRAPIVNESNLRERRNPQVKAALMEHFDGADSWWDFEKGVPKVEIEDPDQGATLSATLDQ